MNNTWNIETLEPKTFARSPLFQPSPNRWTTLTKDGQLVDVEKREDGLFYTRINTGVWTPAYTSGSVYMVLLKVFAKIILLRKNDSEESGATAVDLDGMQQQERGLQTSECSL